MYIITQYMSAATFIVYRFVERMNFPETLFGLFCKYRTETYDARERIWQKVNNSYMQCTRRLLSMLIIRGYIPNINNSIFGSLLYTYNETIAVINMIIRRSEHIVIIHIKVVCIL